MNSWTDLSEADQACGATANERRVLGHLLQSQWITPGAVSPMTATAIGADEVMVGPYRTTLDNVFHVRAADPDGVPLDVYLRYDCWKIVPLQLFRPLVYYTVFGDGDILKCLHAAVESLLRIGQWRHDVAVLTGAADAARIASTLGDFQLGSRLHIVTVPGDDLLDWCLARYRINSADIFVRYQPLLYLDADVICDAPLDDLCLKLVYSNGIEVLPDHRLDEGNADSSGHWFGWRLMQADNVPFFPDEPGSSTGILGFPNARLADSVFMAIRKAAYGHAASVGNRHHFGGYDQPFANYVLKKVGLGSHALLPASAQLCRVDPLESPLPVPTAAKGLTHFHGIVGDAPSKRLAMENYLAKLVAPPPATAL